MVCFFEIGSGSLAGDASERLSLSRSPSSEKRRKILCRGGLYGFASIVQCLLSFVPEAESLSESERPFLGFAQ